MFKAIKRLITSGLKPHSCKLCNTCYVCHECLRERNQIRQCCFGVTEEELDVLHEELKKNFSLLYPVRKYSININTNSSQSENVDDDAENCCVNSRDWSNFQCNICGKSFKTEFTLTRHFNAHAKVGEKFKCQTCGKCFAINRDLQKHCKTHRNVENKSRVCMYCEKEFNSWYYLKIHMRRHTGERPFKCELCNNAYTTRSILNIHYRTHATEINVHNEHLRNQTHAVEINVHNEHLRNQTHAMEINVHNEHLGNKLADSYLEALEDENDSFSEQESFDLENLEQEESNNIISDDQDFITNLSDHFNLEDDFDDDEISQQNIDLSLDKDLNLDASFEDNISEQKNYKSPLVIKLKPSA